MKIKANKSILWKGVFYEMGKNYIIPDEIAGQLIETGAVESISRIIFVCPECRTITKNIIERIETIEEQVYRPTDKTSIFFSKDFLKEEIVSKKVIFMECGHELEGNFNPSDYLVITDDDKKVFIKLGLKLLNYEKELNKLLFGDKGVIENESIDIINKEVEKNSEKRTGKTYKGKLQKNTKSNKRANK